MIERNNGPVYEYIMVDLNTQQDFCTCGGANPVVNLAGLIPALRRVIAWTKRNCVPVVSAIDSHRARELVRAGSRTWCVDGSEGQRKVDFTVFPRCARIEVDNTLSVPLDLFEQYQQLIFRERTDDLFANPKADRFMTQMPVGEFVVFGNVLESTVKAVVLGLLSRAKPVAIVPDACGYWDRAAADLAVRQVHAKGANIVTVDELLTRRLTRHRRYRISTCRGWPSGQRRRNGTNSTNGRVRTRPSSPKTRISHESGSINTGPETVG